MSDTAARYRRVYRPDGAGSLTRVQRGRAVRMSFKEHDPSRCPVCRGRKGRDEVSPRLLSLHDRDLGTTRLTSQFGDEALFARLRERAGQSGGAR